MAEHDGLSVPLRESCNLLVQRRQLVGVAAWLLPVRQGELAGLSLMDSPRRCAASRPARHVRGDSKKPTRERITLPDRACTPQEHQECRLEGIFDVIRIVEKLPANMQYHRPVPLNQESESSLGRGAFGDQESVKQLAIGNVAGHAELKDRADVLQQSRACRSAGHGGYLPSF